MYRITVRPGIRVLMALYGERTWSLRRRRLFVRSFVCSLSMCCFAFFSWLVGFHSHLVPLACAGLYGGDIRPHRGTRDRDCVLTLTVPFLTWSATLEHTIIVHSATHVASILFVYSKILKFFGILSFGTSQFFFIICNTFFMMRKVISSTVNNKTQSLFS